MTFCTSALSCYAECHIFYCYSECRYAECRFTECYVIVSGVPEIEIIRSLVFSVFDFVGGNGFN